MDDRSASAAIDARIDAWVERTRAMTGSEAWEREVWNREASADAIRQFVYGTDDDNPLWRDPAYAARTRAGGVLAPPGFLVSVLYPILHGAPMAAPLTSLIGGLEYEWFRPIRLGDRLEARPVQKDFYEKRNKQGRRLNFVISEVTYTNQRGETVAVATGTMIMATQAGSELLFDRPVKHYSEAEIAALDAAFERETRTGARPFAFEDVRVGDKLPPMVRGPLTIGDLVSYYAGAGPSWKAGRWGRLDLKKKPHAQIPHPVLGLPAPYGLKHLDQHLAVAGGMPAPFDVGVMRFATVAPLLTDWMGDDGFLKKLYVQVAKPVIYGDTVTYGGTVSALDAAAGVATLEIEGLNQLGEVTTKGRGEVRLPRRA